MRFATFRIQYDLEVIPDNSAIQGNGHRVQVAFSNLPEMSSTYQAGITGIVLDLVIFYVRIFFNYHFHHLVGKTFGYTQRRISFHHLEMPVFTHINQAARLTKNIAGSGICNIIDVYRMFRFIPFLNMHKYASLYKCSVERIDTIFQIMPAMTQVLRNNVL